LEYLYLAAPEIARQVPRLRLVVAGKPVTGYVPPVPPELPNGGQVVLIDGYISNAKLAELCQQASVVVCPYVDATQSGVVLTAYAFRKPVVATCVGGLPEYVEDGVTGYLVPPRDSAALSDAVVKVLRDPNRREEMGRQIELLARTTLSWERTADDLLDIYRRAPGRGGSQH
jgi:glycosyltransferase involved in cell wall biosynthesis